MLYSWSEKKIPKIIVVLAAKIEVLSPMPAVTSKGKLSPKLSQNTFFQWFYQNYFEQIKRIKF